MAQSYENNNLNSHLIYSEKYHYEMENKCKFDFLSNSSFLETLFFGFGRTKRNVELKGKNEVRGMVWVLNLMKDKVMMKHCKIWAYLGKTMCAKVKDNFRFLFHLRYISSAR